MKKYNETIRDLREDHDLTQKQVAAILKISPQYYSKYEQGKNELPIRHLITLCKLYKTSADYILNIPTYKGPRHKVSAKKAG